MGCMVRLWEKLTGREHQRAESRKVASVAARLNARTDELNESLMRLSKSPDPFVAMLAEQYERHQESQIWRGPE